MASEKTSPMAVNVLNYDADPTGAKDSTAAIQKAINDGCGVNMTMPSANSNKLSLPIWTGTATQYATLTPVAGMTYNIIDE